MVPQLVETLRYKPEVHKFVSQCFHFISFLPAALWPRGRLNLWHKQVPEIFPGGKGGWFIGLTTLPPSSANCLEIWVPQPPGTLRDCPGLYRDSFTLALH
jgi:hypothetical protein